MRTVFKFLIMAAALGMAFAGCSKEEETKDGGGKPSGGNGNGGKHEYVDLGLPSGTLWATCNVGATKPEEYGDYFAWGETATKTTYTTENSKWAGIEYSDLKAQGVIDANGNLTAKYDAATANWGEEWRMPTLDEIKELTTWTKKESVELNGVKGINFIGGNGNALFLPFVGFYYKDGLYTTDERGNYWSATAYENEHQAYELYMTSWEYEIRDSRSHRSYGGSIRSVRRSK